MLLSFLIELIHGCLTNVI